MESADGDGVFVADLAAERARLGEANVMRLTRRPAADNAGLRGHELAVLLIAQRIVFPVMRRRGAPGPEGRMMAAAAVSSVGARKGFSTGEAIPAAGADCGSASREEAASIAASLSRKPDSTLSASAAISVFLAARLAWTQSAASSADWSWPRLASNRSRNAADCSVARSSRAGRMGFSLPRGAAIAEVPASDAGGGRSWASMPASSALVAASAFAPSAKSGASRSSSPAIPTRVKSAWW
jgi:hypothetical protein